MPTQVTDVHFMYTICSRTVQVRGPWSGVHALQPRRVRCLKLYTYSKRTYTVTRTPVKGKISRCANTVHKLYIALYNTDVRCPTHH